MDGGLFFPKLELTTTEILYHIPDYPNVLQTFVWQTYDTAPQFPRVVKFLDFWTRSLEGVLHSVKLVHTGAERTTWRYAEGTFSIH